MAALGDLGEVKLATDLVEVEPGIVTILDGSAIVLRQVTAVYVGVEFRQGLQ